MEHVSNQTSEYGAAGDIAVLIPAYEPDGHLLATVKGVLAEGLGPVVVVDDGSSPDRAAYFDGLEELGVFVCRHSRNLGKGAAIKTGVRYISEHFQRCRGAVTADADGQHSPADIRRVAERTGRTDTLVLGVRDFSQEGVPLGSLVGNRVTSVIFRLITGVSCPDTQTGLRGIPARLFPLALSTEGERYEYEMNFLLDAAERGYSIEMTPIRTIYIDQNRASHFRMFRDSFLIYRRPLTFLAGSAASSLVDLAAFWLFSHFLFRDDRSYLFSASVLARLISGCVNFFLNKKLTFRSRGNTARESGRYLCLFLAVMLISGKAVALLSWAPIPALWIKAAVDAVLFVVNYFVQRKWVFRRDEGKS